MSNSLFQLKLALVVIVTINGYILHRILWPKVKRSVLTGVYPPALMKRAALAGSVSVVTWFAIVVLSLTKTIDYSALLYLFLYGLALAVAYLTAVYVESHKKRRNAA